MFSFCSCAPPRRPPPCPPASTPFRQAPPSFHRRTRALRGSTEWAVTAWASCVKRGISRKILIGLISTASRSPSPRFGGERVCPRTRSGGRAWATGRERSPEDSQMAPHLLENTRNRLGNGRPRAELDPGMRFLSWRPGLAVTLARKIRRKLLKWLIPRPGSRPLSPRSAQVRRTRSTTASASPSAPAAARKIRCKPLKRLIPRLGSRPLSPRPARARRHGRRPRLTGNGMAAP